MKYYVRVICFELIPGSEPEQFKSSERLSDYGSYEEAAFHLINAITHNRPSYSIKYSFQLFSELDFKSV